MKICERCHAEVSDNGMCGSLSESVLKHSVDECIEYLAQENRQLKNDIHNLEVRLDRVINRHNLDDSKFGKGF